MSNSNRPSPEVQVIIDSFRRSDFTVAAMEADGFTHVQGVCASCGSIVMNPFRLMRLQKKIKDTTTLAQIGAAYRCKTCGGRQPVGDTLQPTYQYMGTAADTGVSSPVNRRLPERK
jgi:DNA-directed RNA polymerase subunit RPC12/RpoP